MHTGGRIFGRRGFWRHVVPKTVGELPATVPASPGALVMAGLLPEHEFPTNNTQRSQRMGSTPATAEPETTVPASHSALVAGGMAVDVPPTLLDELEEDLESTVFAPGEDTVPVQPQGLFAAGVVENTPTMHEAGGVSEGAPQVLPATFALDAEDTESLASRNSAVSRMEDVGGGGPLNNRRLMLVWDRDQDVPPEVRNAVNLIRTLATRVGAVPHGGVIPGTIRRQRWSPLNVPLMWGAARQEETCPLVEWLISVTSVMAEPMHFFGSDMAPSAAVRVGWTALRAVLRSWCIGSEAELSTWLGNHGFPATRPGNHITARAPEHILTTACGEDARVALLESVFVALTLEDVRCFEQFLDVMRRSAARIRRSEVPIEVPSGSWVSMDQVDLEEEFLRRTPMLKSCPHFLRGRFRHCLSVTLQERCRAKLVGDLLVKSELGKPSVSFRTCCFTSPRGQATSANRS